MGSHQSREPHIHKADRQIHRPVCHPEASGCWAWSLPTKEGLASVAGACVQESRKLFIQCWFCHYSVSSRMRVQSAIVALLFPITCSVGLKDRAVFTHHCQIGYLPFLPFIAGSRHLQTAALLWALRVFTKLMGIGASKQSRECCILSPSVTSQERLPEQEK